MSNITVVLNKHRIQCTDISRKIITLAQKLFPKICDSNSIEAVQCGLVRIQLKDRYRVPSRQLSHSGTLA